MVYVLQNMDPTQLYKAVVCGTFSTYFCGSQNLNLLTFKISLEILLAAFLTILMMSVWRIWYWINI